jgi:hypothetical protein
MKKVIFWCTVIVIALTFLEAWGLQLLWNWLAPLFWKTAPILTYWQAFGCSVLLSIVGSAFKTHTTKE